MNTELYLDIKARILDQVTDLKDVRLFNNQFLRSNNDTTDNNTEQAFLYPCCFIEFTDIEYKQQLQNIQEFLGTMRLYIGFERDRKSTRLNSSH